MGKRSPLILVLGDKTATLITTAKGVIGDVWVLNSPSDLASILEVQPFQPVTVLFNLSSMTYETKTVPPLKRRDKWFYKRSLYRRYAHEGVSFLGMELENHQVCLFKILEKQENPWLKILLEQGWPVRGFYALPWGGFSILKPKITNESKGWRLLITTHPPNGLRHSTFHGDHFRFTRLTPSPDDALPLKEQAAFMAAGIEETLAYIARLESEKVHVYIVTKEAYFPFWQGRFTQARSCSFYKESDLMPPIPPSTSANGDILYISCFLQRDKDFLPLMTLQADRQQWQNYWWLFQSGQWMHRFIPVMAICFSLGAFFLHKKNQDLREKIQQTHQCYEQLYPHYLSLQAPLASETRCHTQELLHIIKQQMQPSFLEITPHIATSLQKKGELTGLEWSTQPGEQIFTLEMSALETNKRETFKQHLKRALPSAEITFVEAGKREVTGHISRSLQANTTSSVQRKKDPSVLKIRIPL